MIEKLFNWFINLFISDKVLYLSEDNSYQWFDKELEILRLINSKRQKPLTADLNLYYFAKGRTTHLEFYPKTGHEGYFETVNILGDLGFEQTGETLSFNIKTPKNIVEAFMKSPEHAKILLDERYKYAGVSFHPAGKKTYVCVILGR